jgi:hypothetical protein
MLVEAPPSTAFEVIRPNVLPELEMIALDPPAQLDNGGVLLERDIAARRAASSIHSCGK